MVVDWGEDRRSRTGGVSDRLTVARWISDSRAPRSVRSAFTASLPRRRLAARGINARSASEIQPILHNANGACRDGWADRQILRQYHRARDNSIDAGAGGGPAIELLVYFGVVVPMNDPIHGVSIHLNRFVRSEWSMSPDDAVGIAREEHLTRRRHGNQRDHATNSWQTSPCRWPMLPHETSRSAVR